MREVNDFYDGFYKMLKLLQNEQITLYNDIEDIDIQLALERNIAFLLL